MLIERANALCKTPSTILRQRHLAWIPSSTRSKVRGCRRLCAGLLSRGSRRRRGWHDEYAARMPQSRGPPRRNFWCRRRHHRIPASRDVGGTPRNMTMKLCAARAPRRNDPCCRGSEADPMSERRDSTPDSGHAPCWNVAGATTRAQWIRMGSRFGRPSDRAVRVVPHRSIGTRRVSTYLYHRRHGPHPAYQSSQGRHRRRTPHELPTRGRKPRHRS